MRERFWQLIVDVKIAERYYWHYISISKRYDYLISGLCLFASAASISAWCIWERFPSVWAVITGAAQVVSTFKPLLPFPKRVRAATYVQQDIQGMFIDMETAWDRYGDNASDKQLSLLVGNFKKRLREIEDRFAPPDLFPQKKDIHATAQREAEIYFSGYYGCKINAEGGD